MSQKQKIFGNDLVAICKVTQLNNLAYAGMYILDLSKVLMYEFHYNYIKNVYCNKSRVLFTNNDCLMYEIKIGNAYESFDKDEIGDM